VLPLHPSQSAAFCALLQNLAATRTPLRKPKLRTVEGENWEESAGEMPGKTRGYGLRKDYDEELHVVQTPRFIRTPKAPEWKIYRWGIVSCPDPPKQREKLASDAV
jgi:hypothetical protein